MTPTSRLLRPLRLGTTLVAGAMLAAALLAHLGLLTPIASALGYGYEGYGKQRVEERMPPRGTVTTPGTVHGKKFTAAVTVDGFAHVRQRLYLDNGATIARKAPKGAAKGKAKAKRRPKAVLLGVGNARATRAGVVLVTVRLTGQATKAVKRERRVRALLVTELRRGQLSRRLEARRITVAR